LKLLRNFLDSLRNNLLILNSDLRSIGTIGTSQGCWNVFLLFDLLQCRLISLNINDTLIKHILLVVAQRLSLSYPLILSNFGSIFELVILVGRLDNLICYSFLHEVNFTLPYYFHQLILEWDLEFLIPYIFLLI